MVGISSLLQRASQDTAESSRYMARHCDLSFDQEGLIFKLAGPHQVAYSRMSDGLDKLARLLQSAATQVSLAKDEYAKSDIGVAASLDQAYQGASSPSNLRGTLADPPRPDLWPVAPRSSFEDVVEPSTRLVSPSYVIGIEIFQINPLSDLISPAAWLRQVSVWLFGNDPFEGWGKTFSGDLEVLRSLRLCVANNW